MLILLTAACNAPPDPKSDAAAQNPFIAHALESHERTWREGHVIERLAAGPYVYLRVRDLEGNVEWYASLSATTPSATHVRALVVGRAARFESARLGRVFSPLSFAAVRRAAELPNTQTTPETTP
jgi:hypothetical protein